MVDAQNLRRRYRLVTVVLVLGFFGIGAIIPKPSWMFLAFFFAWAVFSGTLIMWICRCPFCGKQLLAIPIDLLGIKTEFYLPWLPRNCRHCGKAVDSTESGYKKI